MTDLAGVSFTNNLSFTVDSPLPVPAPGVLLLALMGVLATLRQRVRRQGSLHGAGDR